MVIFGSPDEKDPNIIHYPRRVNLVENKMELYTMLGNPEFIMANQNNIDVFYDTDHQGCKETYWASIPATRNLILSINKKLV